MCNKAPVQCIHVPLHQSEHVSLSVSFRKNLCIGPFSSLVSKEKDLIGIVKIHCLGRTFVVWFRNVVTLIYRCVIFTLNNPVVYEIQTRILNVLYAKYIHVTFSFPYNGVHVVVNRMAYEVPVSSMLCIGCKTNGRHFCHRLQ